MKTNPKSQKTRNNNKYVVCAYLVNWKLSFKRRNKTSWMRLNMLNVRIKRIYNKSKCYYNYNETLGAIRT